MIVFAHASECTTHTDDGQGSGEILSMTTVGDRIREARKLRGLSQAALAKVYGCSPGMIGNLESGLRERPKDVLGLARALRVNAEWLDTGDGEIEGGNVQPLPHPAKQGAAAQFSYEALALASELDRIKDQRTRSIRFAQCMMVLTDQSYTQPSGAPTPEHLPTPNTARERTRG